VDDRVEVGKGDFDADALYQQQYVDEKELRRRIRRCLKGRSQVTLAQICQDHPVEKGLSEILAYLHLACKDDNAVVDTDAGIPILYRDAGGRVRKVIMPEVIFVP
jgi:hypothetical protein